MKLSVPHIKNSDIKSIKDVMKSGWISTSADVVDDFEKRVSSFCKTKFSVVLNSGTSAIHLGLKVLGVNKNCEVIVPSITFIATVNPILYLGAKPIIFDVDQYHNLKIEDVINFIKTQTKFKNKKTINKKTKKEIRAIIITHMWGRACNFLELRNLCKKRNIFILEDAAESLGSYLNMWRPLNLQKYLKKFETYNIIHAKKIYSNSLCVPSDDSLSISDIDEITNYIIKYYNKIKLSKNL